MSLSLLESHVIENKRVDSFSVRILLLLDYLYIGSFPGMHRALVTGNHLDTGVCHPSCVTKIPDAMPAIYMSLLRLVSAYDERWE